MEIHAFTLSTNVYQAPISVSGTVLSSGIKWYLPLWSWHSRRKAGDKQIITCIWTLLSECNQCCDETESRVRGQRGPEVGGAFSIRESGEASAEREVRKPAAWGTASQTEGTASIRA